MGVTFVIPTPLCMLQKSYSEKLFVRQIHTKLTYSATLLTVLYIDTSSGDSGVANISSMTVCIQLLLY